MTRGLWPFLGAPLDPLSQYRPGKMRQLKGKPKKETSKDKKERKQAMQEARQQITTVVLPTLAVVVLLIVVFVYVATRPTVAEERAAGCGHHGQGEEALEGKAVEKWLSSSELSMMLGCKQEHPVFSSL